MKTVGINVTHDASLCQCVNGEIDLFIEEERLSRKKHDTMPIKVIFEHLEKANLGLTGLEYSDYDLKDTAAFIDVAIRKTIKKQEFNIYKEHHLLHALCGFYNSEFDEADVVVVDGMGNYIDENYHECASRWHISKPDVVHLIEKQGTVRFDCEKLQDKDIHGTFPMGIGMAYSAISSYLGFGCLGSGKVMGLAPYGKEDPNIKPFVLDDGLVNSKLFYRTQYGANFIPYDYLPEDWYYPKWDDNVQKIANLAYRLQKDFEKWMTEFILRCDHKNIVLTGGCALNCVANYEYLKYLPKGVKLYIEPVSGDAGTAIGLAKYLYYNNL
ncbi:MAG: hypothetical protein CBC73_05600 [Flavobacteriales bacterium TMED113]|nr:MAG: hypothetical protein CBC73_05600 [Flavobacteriales bacterium TMED113]|tara:strand:+ start:450 stop:1427 length:978 start_codon:yes stop_codon:yes gene_type:complete